MKLGRYLSRLGYGSRREVQTLFRNERVKHISGEALSFDDGVDEVAGSSVDHASVRVDGEELDVPPDSVIMLHKPTGFACSTVDTNPLVYDLLPERFARRIPVIAPVGRLDLNTSGLLLLTDNGKLNHRITSPRSHLRKTYRVALAEPLAGHERELFESGAIELSGEQEKLRPAQFEVIASTEVLVAITEGRYHQVRRMFAAVGNHVISLHRAAIGALELGELPVGSWQLLSVTEQQSIFAPVNREIS